MIDAVAAERKICVPQRRTGSRPTNAFGLETLLWQELYPWVSPLSLAVYVILVYIVLVVSSLLVVINVALSNYLRESGFVANMSSQKFVSYFPSLYYWLNVCFCHLNNVTQRLHWYNNCGDIFWWHFWHVWCMWLSLCILALHILCSICNNYKQYIAKVSSIDFV